MMPSEAVLVPFLAAAIFAAGGAWSQLRQLAREQRALGGKVEKILAVLQRHGLNGGLDSWPEKSTVGDASGFRRG
jgi:hypothetical protein